MISLHREGIGDQKALVEKQGRKRKRAETSRIVATRSTKRERKSITPTNISRARRSPSAFVASFPIVRSSVFNSLSRRKQKSDQPRPSLAFYKSFFSFSMAAPFRFFHVENSSRARTSLAHFTPPHSPSSSSSSFFFFNLRQPNLRRRLGPVHQVGLTLGNLLFPLHVRSQFCKPLPHRLGGRHL